MEGKWVSANTSYAPWIVGSFIARKVHSAKITLGCLGFFELYVNGQRIGDEVLIPVWSQYTSRTGARLLYPIHDQLGCRIYSITYDLSGVLREGENEIAVLLGNGWYSQNMRNVEGDLWYGERPQLCFDLKWIDAEGRKHAFISGEHLHWYASAIVMNNVYFGETQDLRICDREKKPVDIAQAPSAPVEEQRCPGDRVIRKIIPVQLGSREGKTIYDAGENITGWVRIQLSGKAGEKTVVRYAEELSAEGELDFYSSGGDDQQQTDTYFNDGSVKSCAPHFTWHGFRYFEIAGPHKQPVVEVVHSDVPVTGRFRCSDETLNWLIDSYLRSRLGNMHCGVPSDCPHRERLGYTGDGQACADTDMKLLDADAFYRKWIHDIQDCQCRISGHVQHTAPFYGGGGGPGGWGGAIVLVPWAHYERYQRLDVLEKAYPFMLKWIAYMESRMDERGLVVREEEGGWCLGDWCTPEEPILPEAYVNTCILARCVDIVIQTAKLLQNDAKELAALLEKVKVAVHNAYYDETSGCYVQGVQGADAFALEAGLGGQALADKMAAYYDANPWFDTGFLGTGSVIRQLMAYGYADVAVKLLTNQRPGYSFWWHKQQGATTLWERWDGRESHNHPMFGGCIGGMLDGLLGIKQDGMLSPQAVRRLEWVEGEMETHAGRVKLSWRWTENGLLVNAEVPAESELKMAGCSYRLEAGKNELLLNL